MLADIYTNVSWQPRSSWAVWGFIQNLELLGSSEVMEMMVPDLYCLQDYPQHIRALPSHGMLGQKGEKLDILGWILILISYSYCSEPSIFRSLVDFSVWKPTIQISSNLIFQGFQNCMLSLDKILMQYLPHLGKPQSPVDNDPYSSECFTSILANSNPSPGKRMQANSRQSRKNSETCATRIFHLEIPSSFGTGSHLEGCLQWRNVCTKGRGKSQDEAGQCATKHDDPRSQIHLRDGHCLHEGGDIRDNVDVLDSLKQTKMCFAKCKLKILLSKNTVIPVEIKRNKLEQTPIKPQECQNKPTGWVLTVQTMIEVCPNVTRIFGSNTCFLKRHISTSCLKRKLENASQTHLNLKCPHTTIFAAKLSALCSITPGQINSRFRLGEWFPCKQNTFSKEVVTMNSSHPSSALGPIQFGKHFIVDASLW